MDTDADRLAGSRVATAAIRDVLNDERTRSDRYLVALAKIAGMRGRADADEAFGEACDLADAVIAGKAVP